MLHSWIKQFIRVSVKGKFYTIVNIVGLAIGLMSAIIILLWIDYQVSFDRFHPDHDKIFAVYKVQSLADGYKQYEYLTPALLSGLMIDKFPEVKSSTRIHFSNEVLGFGDKTFRDYGLAFTDSTFFNIFKIEFISGNKNQCLYDINSIVLTEKLASKLFGTIDIIGKSVRLNGRLDLKVTAVIRDFPKNSDISFSCLIPFEMISMLGERGTNSWNSDFNYTYVKLKSRDRIKEFENKIQIETKKLGVAENTNFYLLPLEDVRLVNPDPKGYNYIIRFIVLGLAAGFVLILACINFINFTTARAANRAKEVGIRKVVGSSRSQLIAQYFMESFFSTGISLFIAILLVDMALPIFNQIGGSHVTMDFTDIHFWYKILIVILAVSISSGIYPALVLSSFQPVKVLKGIMRSGAKGKGFRKAMVIIQYTITIFLAVITFFMIKQLNFISNVNTGMSRKGIITLHFSKEMEPKYRSFKNELMKIPNVKYVTGVVNPPFAIYSTTSDVSWSGKDTTQFYLFSNTTSDDFFTDAMEIKMAMGRYYSSEYPSDTSCVVINETAAKVVNKNPILGETVTIYGRKLKIIGVMKDFHFTHFTDNIKPLFIRYDLKARGFKFIQIKAQNPSDSQTMEQIKKVYSDFYPDFLFETTLLEDDYQDMFEIEKQLKFILVQFTILAMLISCIGLLSLAAFIAEQQRKSLVLRKIHGASMVKIVFILLGSFTKWVIVSGVIAIPLSYLALKVLFSKYAFHTEYSWWVFAGTVGFALIIATLTVLYQALKTARVNPVEILRYE